MTATTLTHESAKAQLEQIIEAATVGAFPGGSAMNNAIYNNAALLLWAIQNSGTQEGDLVEVQNFVIDLQTQFAVGGAK